MILLVQPFGLNSAGGGPRILRALLQDAPRPFVSICTSPQPPPPTNLGVELHLPTRPGLGRLERSRFGRACSSLDLLYAGRFGRRLERICRERQATAIHAIAHSLDFWPAFQSAQRLGLPYFLSVHDDLRYALQGRAELRTALDCLKSTWRGAEARFVISQAMGEEYCRRYGDRPFTIITDGLTEIAPEPRPRAPKTLRVYFSGALHLSYEPNLRALCGGLDLVRRERPDTVVSLTCRGGAMPWQSGAVAVNWLPWDSEEVIANDMEEADLLYLPLPFGRKHELFVRYSLSTKMVTYLGSGLPILYHGPAETAAGRMLSQHEAAIVLDSLDPAAIRDTLVASGEKQEQRVRSALHLGRREFRLSDQRERFWSAITGQVSRSAVLARGLAST